MYSSTTERLKKALRFGLRKSFALLRRVTGLVFRARDLLYLAPDPPPAEQADIQQRFHFYLPQLDFQALERRASLTWADAFSNRPIMVFGPISPLTRWLIELRQGTYDVDFRRNPHDALAWCDLLNHLSPPSTDWRAVKARFVRRVAELRALGLRKCYLFGTGPSLAKAKSRDWSDGYRVVCNTIVRDRDLWLHLKPHFIVAADANYHFGHTEFARRFRRDLQACLRLTDSAFVYPARFHGLVQREFAELQARLFPIPQGSHTRIHVDLTRRFRTPALGNVLALLLLPLGCTLAREICLWGFDGRAPADQLFWSNSPKHSYPELMPALQAAYPAFFRHYVPHDDQEKYVRQHHGDLLDRKLSQAERRGFTFIMLHPSWTPTLQKRYRAPQSRSG